MPRPRKVSWSTEGECLKHSSNKLVFEQTTKNRYIKGLGCEVCEAKLEMFYVTTWVHCVALRGAAWQDSSARCLHHLHKNNPKETTTRGGAAALTTVKRAFLIRRALPSSKHLVRRALESVISHVTVNWSEVFRISASVTTSLSLFRYCGVVSDERLALWQVLTDCMSFWRPTEKVRRPRVCMNAN